MWLPFELEGTSHLVVTFVAFSLLISNNVSMGAAIVAQDSRLFLGDLKCKFRGT